MAAFRPEEQDVRLQDVVLVEDDVERGGQGNPSGRARMFVQQQEHRLDGEPAPAAAATARRRAPPREFRSGARRPAWPEGRCSRPATARPAWTPWYHSEAVQIPCRRARRAGRASNGTGTAETAIATLPSASRNQACAA